jgi:5-methylcytosine-specific restriction endonuclease McrA
VPTVPTDQLAAQCTLTEWSGEPDRCRWCDTPLVGRQTAWCCTRHADLFWNSHTWTRARAVALMTGAWTCVLCGRGQAADRLLHWLLPTISPAEWRRWPAEEPEVAAAWWEWTTPALEVDHIEPVWGQRGPGCQHHADNLRVLCHECHVAETARWRAVRRAMRDAFGIDIAAPPEAVPAAA